MLQRLSNLSPNLVTPDPFRPVLGTSDIFSHINFEGLLTDPPTNARSTRHAVRRVQWCLRPQTQFKFTDFCLKLQFRVQIGSESVCLSLLSGVSGVSQTCFIEAVSDPPQACMLFGWAEPAQGQFSLRLSKGTPGRSAIAQPECVVHVRAYFATGVPKYIIRNATCWKCA